MSADNPEPGDIFSCYGDDTVCIISKTGTQIATYEDDTMRDCGRNTFMLDPHHFRGNIKASIIKLHEYLGALNDS